ncbi:hypothetical protein Ancab_028774 [Ancistrocladus abbreviatus]
MAVSITKQKVWRRKKAESFVTMVFQLLYLIFFTNWFCCWADIVLNDRNALVSYIDSEVPSSDHKLFCDPKVVFAFIFDLILTTTTTTTTATTCTTTM